ncbi:MAG: hypothetical protein J5556_06325 [Deltaproteobacteria bacterium]|nr:hypothetical protein [Deltaproteobacteria bacterium]
MGAPQIIVIVLMALDLLLVACVHGEKKEGKYNFPAELMSKAIFAWLLWLGGFWG